jgi:hypothetical protein
MEIEHIASQIQFRFVQTDTRLPDGINSFILRHASIRTIMERMNTIVPHSMNRAWNAVQEISDYKRMSTMIIGALINECVHHMPSHQSYINVGTWAGFSLFAGMIGNPNASCIGIDNFSQFSGPREIFFSNFERYRSQNHLFYDMDYTEYFQSMQLEKNIGVYFYDGNHSYDDQLLGLEIVEEYLVDGGYIIIDDTNWAEPRSATEDFLQNRQDTYKLILNMRTAQNMHPTFWNGLMIIQKI